MCNKKEKEKNEAVQNYRHYLKNFGFIQDKLHKNQEKLSLIRQKNNNMKLLICKLISNGK